nr:bifunctional proline dehydrogenase/L-glutamate gamma-semialdehyde dehydrogenase PutA [Algicella marina]
MNKRLDETVALHALEQSADLDAAARKRIVASAADLVTAIRRDARPGMMDVFLAEYGLSTEEGVALMCLAEALLRVPDTATIDALIEDKIAPSDWSSHIGHSSSPLVNASTWGLFLTGKVLDDDQPGVAGTLRGMVRRLGEPVIRRAVGQAMREMGRQFVLGQDISAAMERARTKEAQGFTYSYDMLGEAAMTATDARRYADSYARAIESIAAGCNSSEIASNPGISVKLSALHPRYEVAKTERVMDELVPVLRKLARAAAKGGMGLNIDAEEADRLALSLKVIEAVLADDTLEGWDGFGVVVQAYGRRAPEVITGLYELASRLDRRIMVRLVKGAYWDTEIKHAQVQGLTDFPVFTRKAATDVSYLGCARQLLRMTDRIYPQFATHNAHTVAAVLDMAQYLGRETFEFQRLHGMGEALHDIVHKRHDTRCRIYAPVGAHRDLLAYLVRRLLENGANSSFVNRIVDKSVPAEAVAACPFTALAGPRDDFEPLVAPGTDLYLPERTNSMGIDLFDVTELRDVWDQRKRPAKWHVGPILATDVQGGEAEPAYNPATGERIGTVTSASEADVEAATVNSSPWDASVEERSNVLKKAAKRYEEDFATLFALLATEAGKTLADSVAELREAVDFLRYYASEAKRLNTPARGIFTCISPWNFPLAIFTGQIAAALATGNGVLAKPAETTPAIADWAVRHLLAAGVPASALQLLPGDGDKVGKALTSSNKVNGVAFTGSTATARHIQRAMAENMAPGTPLIAETGGLNCMIVDSTALPEQAVRDIVASAFQSAGQRCSALRCLYVQEDVADTFQEMIIGAMNELQIGDPWEFSTDVGPVITQAAKDDICAYVATAEWEGRLIHRLSCPDKGNFVPPSLISVSGVLKLDREVFGPVLHIATFRARDLDKVINDVNSTGYGLTFGIHTRIDDRVQMVADRVEAGNIYTNRNQIGAIVGSQPFGGEGLSGTGPKAGGPHYLLRFVGKNISQCQSVQSSPADVSKLHKRINSNGDQTNHSSVLLPGPTGELNRLATRARPPILCLGPGNAACERQVATVKDLGGQAIAVEGILAPSAIQDLPTIGGLLWWGDTGTAREYAIALAQRDGAIIPLITGEPDRAHALLERHLCVDTTAAGGNASLLAGNSNA